MAPYGGPARATARNEPTIDIISVLQGKGEQVPHFGALFLAVDVCEPRMSFKDGAGRGGASTS